MGSSAIASIPAYHIPAGGLELMRIISINKHGDVIFLVAVLLYEGIRVSNRET